MVVFMHRIRAPLSPFPGLLPGAEAGMGGYPFLQKMAYFPVWEDQCQDRLIIDLEYFFLIQFLHPGGYDAQDGLPEGLDQFGFDMIPVGNEAHFACRTG